MSPPANEKNLQIEVVYALPDEQEVHELALPDGASVDDALRKSGLLDRKFSDESLNIVPQQTPVGIYGEKVAWDVLLEDGDRVEIYRPLVIEPMEARRARARKQQANHKKKDR